MTSTIMIFLPGTTGSTLVSDPEDYATEDAVWPSQVLDHVLGSSIASDLHDTNAATSQLSDALQELTAQDLFPGVPRRAPNPLKGYSGFINHFRLQGFKYHNYSDPSGLQDLPEKLLLGLAYDWRQDNSASADYLRGALQMIDDAYENDYQVFLVAHSMGGLVSRGYLENPKYANDPWRSNIKALITLGTPHLGAPLALLGIEGKLNEIIPSVSLDFDTVIETFLDKSFSDSTYELLPPPHTPFISYDKKGYSIFCPDLPAAVKSAIDGLSQTDLDGAARFFGGLTNQSNLPPYYCVYGLTSQSPTVVSFTYDSTLGLLLIQTAFQGDSIVPQWSASFAGREVAALYSPPGNVTHGQLPGVPDVQRKVAQWMGLSVAD